MMGLGLTGRKLTSWPRNRVFVYFVRIFGD